MHCWKPFQINLSAYASMYLPWIRCGSMYLQIWRKIQINLKANWPRRNDMTDALDTHRYSSLSLCGRPFNFYFSVRTTTHSATRIPWSSRVLRGCENTHSYIYSVESPFHFTCTERSENKNKLSPPRLLQTFMPFPSTVFVLGRPIIPGVPLGPVV